MLPKKNNIQFSNNIPYKHKKNLTQKSNISNNSIIKPEKSMDKSNINLNSSQLCINNQDLSKQENIDKITNINIIVNNNFIKPINKNKKSSLQNDLIIEYKKEKNINLNDVNKNKSFAIINYQYDNINQNKYLINPNRNSSVKNNFNIKNFKSKNKNIYDKNKTNNITKNYYSKIIDSNKSSLKDIISKSKIENKNIVKESKANLSFNDFNDYQINNNNNIKNHSFIQNSYSELAKKIKHDKNSNTNRSNFKSGNIYFKSSMINNKKSNEVSDANKSDILAGLSNHNLSSDFDLNLNSKRAKLSVPHKSHFKQNSGLKEFIINDISEKNKNFDKKVEKEFLCPKNNNSVHQINNISENSCNIKTMNENFNLKNKNSFIQNNNAEGPEELHFMFVNLNHQKKIITYRIEKDDLFNFSKEICEI